MNVSEYTALVNNPDSVTDARTDELELIIQDFPYFQSARALHLKGLYNQNSFKYNYTLKITAAHTTDRAVLFDFITSDNFISIQTDHYDQKLGGLWNMPVIIDASAAPGQSPLIPEQIQKEDITEFSEIDLAPRAAEISPSEESGVPEVRLSDAPASKSETLEIGKPLRFKEGEVHSFSEWLQLSQFRPIDRTADASAPDAENESEKQKKNDLIDRFIETNPKMPKIQGDLPADNPAVVETSVSDSALMTETLARVYLEQKKYKKAIQAYEILILKYPEKSGSFADRISDIKKLQQNNNS